MTAAPPTELNSFDYGFESNHWLLKVALAYVPQKQLHLALVALIDHLVYRNDPQNPADFVELMDVVTQAAFTGKYIPTGEDAPRIGSRPTSDEHATVEPPTLTEDDADAFKTWLGTLPTANDPHDDPSGSDTNKEETPS